MKNQPPGHTGRHFLQILGPTNVPDRVLHAIAYPTIDHRGPDFADLGKEIVGGMRRVFQTDGTVVVYPSSGTGAWEAALVNTLSPGDRVLMFETGWFATLWNKMATRLGLRPEFIKGDWRGNFAARKYQPSGKRAGEYEKEMTERVSGLIGRIRELNETEVYRPNPGASCMWCDFKKLCPLYPEGSSLFPANAPSGGDVT